MEEQSKRTLLLVADESSWRIGKDEVVGNKLDGLMSSRSHGEGAKGFELGAVAHHHMKNDLDEDLAVVSKFCAVEMKDSGLGVMAHYRRMNDLAEVLEGVSKFAESSFVSRWRSDVSEN